jgi:ferredoxin
LGLAYDGLVQVMVRFQPSARTVCVPRGTTLLEAARAAGLPAARACGGDLLCGKCVCTVEGARLAPPGAAEERTKARNRVDVGKRLACAVRLEADVEASAPGW